MFQLSVCEICVSYTTTRISLKIRICSFLSNETDNTVYISYFQIILSAVTRVSGGRGGEREGGKLRERGGKRKMSRNLIWDNKTDINYLKRKEERNTPFPLFKHDDDNKVIKHEFQYCLQLDGNFPQYRHLVHDIWPHVIIVIYGCSSVKFPLFAYKLFFFMRKE